MKNNAKKEERYLEISLIIITIALSCLMWKTAGYKLIVLNLFYLPIVLAAFFLGRYRAGILASFAVIGASIVTAMDLNGFAVNYSPIATGLSVTLWAATLGLTALLVGTLSDERAKSMQDLHDAHMGVVEVLSQYLQSANPKLKIRSQRIAELSQAVAQEMNCTARELDDIRVAALLYDMENIEITAKVIRRAVGELETQAVSPEHSFHGSELAHSLGSVLTGALPLLLGQAESDSLAQIASSNDAPIGAKIIRAVRAYYSFAEEIGADALAWDRPTCSIIDDLRRDLDAAYPEDLLDALELVVASEGPAMRNRTPELASV